MSVQYYRPIVLEALKTKAPKLYAGLQARKELNQFVDDKANEIEDAVSQVRSNLISRQKALSITDHLKKVQTLNEIDSTAKEAVLKDLLQFPSEDRITA